jgi:transposase-like protein
MADLAAASYVAVGRKYGVSDNTIRNWIKSFERNRKSPPGET